MRSRLLPERIRVLRIVAPNGDEETQRARRLYGPGVIQHLFQKMPDISIYSLMFLEGVPGPSRGVVASG